MRIIDRFEPQLRSAFAEAEASETFVKGGNLLVPPATADAIVLAHGGKTRGIDANGTALTVRTAAWPTVGAACLFADRVRVFGQKYGVLLRDMEAAYLHNYEFYDRARNDRFGAALMLGGSNAQGPVNRGPVYADGFWWDLAPGASPTSEWALAPWKPYSEGNNEGLCVETGNFPTSLRRGVLGNGEDAAIDAKSSVYMDGVVAYGGHRTLRMWYDGAIVAANCLFVISPGQRLMWGGHGRPRFAYYNCGFAIAGEDWGAVRSDPPVDWFESELSLPEHQPLEVVKLTADPFDRSAASFWQPVDVRFIPRGLLQGVPYGDVVEAPSPPPPPPPPPPSPSPPVDAETARLQEIGALADQLFRALRGGPALDGGEG